MPGTAGVVVSARNHRKEPARAAASGDATWRYKAVAVVAALAAILGVVGSQMFAAGAAKPHAVERIRQNPPPALFPDTDVSGWTTRLAEQKRAADRLFAQWRTQHGSARDDKAFLVWAAQQVPAPPPGDQRSAELGQLRTLARARTAAGRKAASWLEVHGKQDIWQLYLSDQRELLPAGQGDAARTRLKAALKMAKTISSRLSARYRQPSPYVLDPSLRPEKKKRNGNACPCSYPSSHAAASSAAVTVLSHFAPHRATDYQWMQAEVVYSRVYMAGHVPSDILAGALLGALIGDYVLVTS
ncbi:phosphatase PAP2 family protein [Streptomyces sp. NPDC002758]